MSSLTNEELRARDNSAIEYSKSLLDAGDTLVFIKYPEEIYDPTGFSLYKGHRRVHSEKLLATGSARFAKLLTDDWKQHLMRKRNGYLTTALPTGIKYVLDLTPPDEGDEAVDLIADLSCSAGVRNWFSSVSRCRVPATLVAGKDEISKSQENKASGSSPQFDDYGRAIYAPSLPPTQYDSSKEPEAGKKMSGPFHHTSDEDFARDVVIALEKSEEDERRRSEAAKLPKDGKSKSELVEEYCPFRHRAAIERLLQVIEGKEPHLDSAPKVWTLVGVAKYFDCTQVVVDFILGWIIVEPNSQFIETLPEASFAIGKSLQSPVITRPAFAILVSEEALTIASRMKPSHGSFNHEVRPVPRNMSTNQFLRPTEDIDEDTLTSIQAAATDFQTRIQKRWNELVDSSVPWFQHCAEFKKLKDFEASAPVSGRSHESIERLIYALSNYVRGLILSVLVQPITFKLSESSNAHRKAESYHQPWTGDFQAMYDDMSDAEKIMTKPFWRMFRNCTWDAKIDLNRYYDYIDDKTREQMTRYNFVEVTMPELYRLQDEINHHILDAIRHDRYNKGHIPPECYAWLSPTTPNTWDESWETQAGKYDPDDEVNQAFNCFTQLQQKDESAIHLMGDKPSATTAASPSRYLDEDVLRFDSTSSNAGEPPTMRESASPNHTAKFTTRNLPIRSRVPEEVLPFDMSPRSPTTQHLAPIGADSPTLGNISPFSAGSKSKNAATYDVGGDGWRLPATPSIPFEINILEESPFFSIRNFLRNIKNYLDIVAVEMLSNGEVDFCAITDTILCLNEDELGYLPLWAGGNDDGSGGVFSHHLPPAEMGPNGPGPAYHTGYSVNSTSSDWDNMSDTNTVTVDTSVAAENGFSDHVHRRLVKSNASFGGSSIAFTEDPEDYGRVKTPDFSDGGSTDYGGSRDKGKGIDYGAAGSGGVNSAQQRSDAMDVEFDMDSDMGEVSGGDDDDNEEMLDWSGEESWVDEDGEL